MWTRRQFVKAGLVGGVLLAAVSVLRRGHENQDAVAGGGVDGEIVAAIAPVLLKGIYPDEAGAEREMVRERTVEGVRLAVAALSATAQKEIGELFRLLAFAPTRIAVARVSSPWAQASEAEISAFLQGWRDSRIGLLQSGYQALHDLVLGVWYADPSAWAAIGYPGPPALERP